MSEARAAGYGRMRLDTLPAMRSPWPSTSIWDSPRSRRIATTPCPVRGFSSSTCGKTLIPHRTIMTPESLAFLKSLLDTPGPSSFETAPARAWRKEAESLADEVRADVAGNSYATLNPGGRPRVMLAGHIDEIGVMVTHIDDDGYLSFDTIGGWDPQVFVGQRVRLLGRGGPVAGVVGKKAIHIMDKDDREKVSKVENLWIDIGAANRAEAERQLRIGDPGVLAHGRAGIPQRPSGEPQHRQPDRRLRRARGPPARSRGRPSRRPR